MFALAAKFLLSPARLDKHHPQPAAVESRTIRSPALKGVRKSTVLFILATFRIITVRRTAQNEISPSFLRRAVSSLFLTTLWEPKAPRAWLLRGQSPVTLACYPGTDRPP